MAIDPSGWQVLLVSLIPTQIIAGEEQRDLSYYFFSLTTDINRASKNPQVPTTQSEYSKLYGVRVHFIFASGCLSIPFGLQYLGMATLKEGDYLQMWEFIPSPNRPHRPAQFLS